MRIKHNRKGYAELLKSQAMLDDVTARAKRIAAAAGPGFEATSMLGRNRGPRIRENNRRAIHPPQQPRPDSASALEAGRD